MKGKDLYKNINLKSSIQGYSLIKEINNSLGKTK